MGLQNKNGPLFDGNHTGHCGGLGWPSGLGWLHHHMSVESSGRPAVQCLEALLCDALLLLPLLPLSKGQNSQLGTAAFVPPMWLDVETLGHALCKTTKALSPAEPTRIFPN